MPSRRSATGIGISLSCKMILLKDRETPGRNKEKISWLPSASLTKKSTNRGKDGAVYPLGLYDLYDKEYRYPYGGFGGFSQSLWGDRKGT